VSGTHEAVRKAVFSGMDHQDGDYGQYYYKTYTKKVNQSKF
jgi:hypothetical protein